MSKRDARPAPATPPVLLPATDAVPGTEASAPAGVRVERDGAIATLVLDRAPVNAIDAPMMQALIDHLRQVDADDSVRVVVITGAGRCFSAGVDLKAQLGALESGGQGPMDHGVALYDALLNGPKPRIAAVNGAALGAGLGIAASCHLVLAADGVRFGLPEIDVGALGGARHAMRLLGYAAASRMLLTGEPMAAEELARRGAIVGCWPLAELMPQAMALARAVAAKHPPAVALACRCLAAVETLPVLDGYAFEAGLGRQLGETPEAQALMRGFLHRSR